MGLDMVLGCLAKGEPFLKSDWAKKIDFISLIDMQSINIK